MEDNQIAFCNCNECKFEQVCCSSDGWSITLSPDETKRFPHSIRPDGSMVIASGPDGYCMYRNPDDGKCRVYDQRPEVCKRFSCQNMEERMGNLLRQHKEIRSNLDATFTGYFVAFVTKTDAIPRIAPMEVHDPRSHKNMKLNPKQVFGNSEEEVKDKIIAIIKQPFTKHD